MLDISRPEAQMGTGAEIKAERLSNSFGRAPAWRDMTFNIPMCEIRVLISPSGTRKSVLLKFLIGLLRSEQH
jgi:ABC-type transporter Mla maintaining outer membrane lipid asymmetry ATPase subunit MlaF